MRLLALAALASSAALALAAPSVPAAAQEPALGFTTEPALDRPLPVAPDQAASLLVTVTNPADEDLVVLLTVDPPAGWNATVLPTEFELPARAAGEPRTFELTVASPLGASPGGYAVRVLLAAANSTTGTAFVHALEVPVEVTHSALVLGFLPNPLPPPLDGAYGVFLLDVVFWAVIAGTIIVMQDPIVKWLTRRAQERVAARIVAMLRVPMFLALVFFGVTQSWSALPPFWWVVLGHRILAAMTILVAMYVVYKAFRAMLLYYTENIAHHTSTQLDDIVVPVLEKVGAVVIVAGGTLYFIGTLGIDLTAFVAGGVVVSMVLAFAAQDTLSNFFSGLSIMVDRPFLRGDDIMLVSGGPLTGDVFRVEAVGLRSTRLYHYRSHQLVVMPNNDLAKNPIANLMHPDHRFRMVVSVGVAYGSDPAKVREILERAAREHPLVEKEPGFEPISLFQAFADSSLNFDLLFYVTNLRPRFKVASEIRERVQRDFAAAGIQIPFPQRVVRVVHEGGSDGAGTRGGAGPGPGHVLAGGTAGLPKAPEHPKRS